MRTLEERLNDIKGAITHIEECTSLGRPFFNDNTLIKIWVIYYWQLIGEAANAIPQDFRDLHPEVSWRLIVGFRNVLVHRYFEIEADIVWEAVQYNLPPLKAMIHTILEKIADSEEEPVITSTEGDLSHG